MASNFLAEDVDPVQYIERLRETDSQTGGYNVVLGNLHTGSLWAHSNRAGQGSFQLGKGLHAISNGRFSDIWPKMRKGLDRLQPMITKLPSFEGVLRFPACSIFLDHSGS